MSVFRQPPNCTIDLISTVERIVVILSFELGKMH